MLNWYTESAWGAEYQDEIAAHEAGHMLGLYDEYEGGALDPDTLFTTTNSLMADLGPTRRWHYEQILEWLGTRSGRDLSLAQSPLPPYALDDPIPDFSDPQVLHVTIESCDSAGSKKDTFHLAEDVYVTGRGYSPSATYDIYVVEDVVAWTDGMTIPSRVSGTATSVFSDASGAISATLVWSDPLVIGKYDIVVDVDSDGVYDEGTDALDDSDIEVTAGFNVIPEVPLGTVMASAAMMIALVTYIVVPKWRRKREYVNL